ncbi:MAG: site-2 protease family protein [Candidatus Micrarchaeota archaeon]
MRTKNIAAGLIIIATALLFYALLVSDANGFIKFLLSLVLLAGCGLSIQSLLGLEGEYGLLLIRTKKGLEYIDVLANAAPRFWQGCADFGTVLGFGASSIFFFKKIPKKTYLFSLFALIIVSQTMMQEVFHVVVTLINIPVELGGLSDHGGPVDILLPIIIIFSMLFFGFCGVTVVGLIANSYSILSNIIGVILSVPGADLADAVPGASPVIPGINMPLIEGLIALAFLLFIHEASHGILSRIGKIKLESAGLLLFGIVPVGAFVDPDEKSLAKKDIDVQTRVFSAGPASNMIVFIVMFFILLAFESFSVPYLDPGVYVHSVDFNSSAYNANITTGTSLVSIDNIPITWDNLEQFRSLVTDSESVTLQTDAGTHVLEPKESVPGGERTLGLRLPPQRYYLGDYYWMGFIKNTLGLIFVLNFLVGVINFMPMFMAFDGYRILSLHTKNKMIVKIISYALLAMLLLNFVPWLWR